MCRSLHSLIAVLLYWASATLCLAQDPLLNTAEQVRRLSPEQAAQHQKVHIKGIVTFYDESLYSRFVQDETAGIYFREMANMPALKAGDVIEIQGQTDAGEYAPVIVPSSVTVVGHDNLPRALPVTIEDLVSGREDSQFVEVSATVRSVRFEEETQNYLIDLVAGAERFVAYTRQLPVTNGEALVEGVLKVRGVCATLFNRQRQLFGFNLLVPSVEDLTLEHPAPEKPFDVAAQPISSLLRFTSQSTAGRRVKVIGSVVYQEPGAALFVQDEKEGLYCQTRQRSPVSLGDKVEILGFPAKGEYTPVLQDSTYRKIGSGSPPLALEINLDEALSGAYDCRLVRMHAKLLEHTQRGREQFITLDRDGFIFNAFLGTENLGPGIAHAEPGSELAITGICLIERGSSWRAGESWRAKSFRILLRSPADVAVLQAPPWWNARRVLWIAGIFAGLTVAASAWVAVLRRRVNQQTEIIQQRLDAEAAMKERYLDLFENANDVLFTHDLEGRVTAINKAGETLLHLNREAIVNRNILELVVEEQRPAARTWLKQITDGDEVQTAEWDFQVDGAQRIKLEISSRLIEQNGRKTGVEAIARDITERRRLEREILDVSNREQRRIGHDLHDGICQQLAAVNYLLDILGDQLKEKGVSESVEAERIAALVNEANGQARSVARGLFPVRLEEHGLVLALEDLAANASTRYRIICRFVTEAVLGRIDSTVELHLYYIVQEAVLNAVKHGKATTVIITLSQQNERFRITIEDNGAGFDLSSRGRPGMGIRIMRYRAGVIGASLDLQSQPNHGTKVTCVFTPTLQEQKADNERASH